MYKCFGLTLTTTHACNLRCTYCYTGEKRRRTMSEQVGFQCIDRAIASLAPGGQLELGFFGGEPLLEANLISKFMTYARSAVARAGKRLTMNMTTNGTVVTDAAWSVMMSRDLNLSVSFDGLPQHHNRHRCTSSGGGTAALVEDTMHRLISNRRVFSVITVVRPDTVDALPDSIEYMQEIGITDIHPALDIWSRWSEGDVRRLVRVIDTCAKIWRRGLPALSIGWFDEKAALLTNVETTPTARCGFGTGEIAVAPSGRLYPCERLIGDDPIDHPLVLPGHAMVGDDFLCMPGPEDRLASHCAPCAMTRECNTICRCSNYVRTGKVHQPDGLLCAWNQACLNATANALRDSIPPPEPPPEGRAHTSRSQSRRARAHSISGDDNRAEPHASACAVCRTSNIAANTEDSRGRQALGFVKLNVTHLERNHEMKGERP